MNNKASLPGSSFAVYLSSIAVLSDRALVERVGRLASREREATAALVAHLAEMEARRLHLKEGYSSLFAYCTEALHLSEQAAYNRIEAARAARRFPIILARLADGSVHLTAIRLLAPLLTEENHEAVLEEACHRSRREVEEIVARVRPGPPVPSSVRRLPEPAAPHPGTVPTAERPAGSGLTMELVLTPGSAAPSNPAPAPAPLCPPGTGTTVELPADSGPAPPGSPALSATSPRPVVTPLAPGLYRVQFTASGEMHARLRHAQALLRHQVPNGDIAAIFDLALQALIERVEARKLAKRKRPRTVRTEGGGQRAESAEREQPRTETADGKRHGVERGERQATHRSTACRQTGPRSRCIPADVRRVVWERDGGRCAYVSPSGRRCTETGFLEFHHKEPHGCGGPATVENIELRCRGHNNYEAEQRFGIEKMRARIPRLSAMASSSREARSRLHPNARRTCENECNSSRDELRMESQARGDPAGGRKRLPEQPG